MNHLEQLVTEFYDCPGYLVKHNVKVGKRKAGGWEMELDIIGFHPLTKHLIHIEPSLDTTSWAIREARFQKKFAAGNKYILSELFGWIDKEIRLEQIAILVDHPKNRSLIGGGVITSVEEFTKKVCDSVTKKGVMSKSAISETYPLLRTIQLVKCGYYKTL